MKNLHVVASVVLVSSVLVGCGADEAGGTAAEGERSVTITHSLGTTEVVGTPRRVVSLDLQWTDTMLALGVTPVGAAGDPSMPGGKVPWQSSLDGSEDLDVTSGLPYEQIADLRPDLIVGSYSVPDEDAFERLSKIAPTIASIEEGQVDRWTDMVRVGGEVTGREDRADEVTADVKQKVEDVAAELPGLQGRSFLLARFSLGDGFLAVGDPEDGSSELFTQLGMQVHEPVREEFERSGDARVPISPELTDMLGADLLVLAVIGGTPEQLDEQPGWSELPSAVDLVDYAEVVALNTPSPLSIPFVLDELRPSLSEVAES